MAHGKKNTHHPAYIGQDDYIRGMKRASREMEIEYYDKQLSTRMGKRIHSSAKDYKRLKRVYPEEDE